MQIQYLVVLSSALGSLLLLLGSLLLKLQLSLELAGISLLDQELLSLDLSLLGVDGLHQHSLVLVLVTLGGSVQLTVQVLVDLLGVAVLLEQTTKDASTSHPKHLEGHTGIHGTLSATVT
jgi:hypothetical protein